MRNSYPPDLSEHKGTASAVPSNSISFLLIELALLLLGGWAYWPALQRIFEAWNSNPDYSHGFLVLPIALGFLWSRRDCQPSRIMPSFCWQGLVLLAFAGGLRFVAGRFYLPEFDGWSIPLWLGGIVWLFHGKPFFRWALPSLAFLWFATPLPGSFEIFLSTPLQHLAADLGSWALRIAGQPAISEGTTILLNEQVLDIERACSGLRMFYGIFALAVAGVVLVRLRGWSAVAVLLAAIPVALIANVFRIAVTGLLLQHVSGEAARKFSHDLAGLVMIPLAVLLFSLLVSWIRNGIDRFRMNRADGLNWFMRWSTGCVLLAGVLWWWGSYQHRYALGALLETAGRYEQEENWPWAVNYLQRYLQANPTDGQIKERFAVNYAKTVSSRREKVRSIDLSYKAWKKNPSREDLALIAARTSLEIGKSRRSLDICEELLARDGEGEHRCEIKFLQADALLNYLEEEESSMEYSWEDLANVLEGTRTCETDELHYEVELARLWQEKLLKPDQKSRTKLADEIMNELVAKHPENPMAWLARHQFLVDFGDSHDASAHKLAEQDLRQALMLIEKLDVEKADGADKTALFLAAAGHSQQQGDLGEAEQFLRQAIAASPTNPRPVVVLAELKRACGDMEARREAIDLLRHGLSIVGDRDLRLLLPLASLQTEVGDWNAAAGNLVLVEEIIPRLTGPHQSQLKLGAGLVRTQILWHREGAYSAIRKLESVVNDDEVRVFRPLFPKLFAQGHVLLGKLYRSVGMADRACDQYRSALQLAPDSQGTRTELVTSALKAGDLESAEHHCRQLLRARPNFVEAWVAMIRIHVRRQLRQPLKFRDWSQAQRTYAEALRHNLSRANLLLAEVELLSAQENLKSAEQLLRQAVQQAPQEPTLWRELALISDQQGEWDHALDAAQKYIQLSPEELDPYVLQATLLEKTNRSQEAQSMLAELLGRCTGNRWVVAAQELARLQMLLGNVEDAKHLLEKVHRKDPANLRVSSTLANLAWVTGDWVSLKQYESWLHEVEGETGTAWRFHRAQRLLEEVESSEDPKFEEVWRLSQTLQNLRPRWSKSSLLLGDIALRSGQVDAAISSFQRAWNLGDRSALLADRLIDLLTRRGRSSEAQSYVSQVRSTLSLSSRLLDRAIPYYVDGGEQTRALKLAEAWIARQPQDATAYLRLGRVLLTMSPQEGKERARHQQRADAAFRQALKLKPKEVNVWVTNVLFLSQEQGAETSLDAILAKLSKQVELDDCSRALVLAQVNEEFDRPLEAQSQYHLANRLAKQQNRTTLQATILGELSRFYRDRVPGLAEQYARAALVLDPNAVLPRQTLLKILIESDQAEALVEAMALLDSSPGGQRAWNVDFQRRTRAILLSRQGKSAGTIQAIHLLETLLKKTTEDNRLLATLYEQQGRLGPAFDILSQMANSPSASPQEAAAFLQFWQRHFLAKSAAQQRPKFLALAKKVYRQLRQSPAQQAEWLRWKIRELKIAPNAEQPSRQAIAALVTELVGENRNLSTWPEGTKLAWCRSLLRVLMEEDLSGAALQFVKEPPANLLDLNVAIAMCHAMILVPESSTHAVQVNALLRTLRTGHPERADLARAIGDYQLMTGQYALAADAYRGALDIEPNHKLSSNNLALSLAELPGKMAEAQAVLVAALEEHGLDPVLLDTRAVLELIDERANDALASLEQVLSVTPENTTARIHAAMAYLALDKQNLMRLSLFDAMSLGINQVLLSPRDRDFFLEMSPQLHPRPTRGTYRVNRGSAQEDKNAVAHSH